MEVYMIDDKRLKTFLKDGRFYVQIENGNGRKKQLPRYQYVWLKYNPSFKEVPKKYVIHHLDGDKLNDDPSNLALMQKFQHIAHHWKSKLVYPEIHLQESERKPHNKTSFYPIDEPKIYFIKAKKRYGLFFREDDQDKKRTVVCKYRGRSLKTQEDAEWAKNLIWDNRTQ